MLNRGPEGIPVLLPGLEKKKKVAPFSRQKEQIAYSRRLIIHVSSFIMSE